MLEFFLSRFLGQLTPAMYIAAIKRLFVFVEASVSGGIDEGGRSSVVRSRLFIFDGSRGRDISECSVAIIGETIVSFSRLMGGIKWSKFAGDSLIVATNCASYATLFSGLNDYYTGFFISELLTGNSLFC